MKTNTKWYKNLKMRNNTLTFYLVVYASVHIKKTHLGYAHTP